MTGVSLEKLDDIFGFEMDEFGVVPLEIAQIRFGGCDLIGSPTIRDDALGYALKPNGQRYGRRHMQQWMADADFLVWRAGIPATMISSWHAYLDGRIAEARAGALARTGHEIVTTCSAGALTRAA
jgi:hypothetical protein